MTTRDDTPAPAPAPEPHIGLMGRFRNYFLTGLVVTGPIAITLYLVWWFVTWVDGVVRPFVPLAYRPETYLPYVIPGWGLIVAVFMLTMLGFLAANLIGRTLVDITQHDKDEFPETGSFIQFHFDDGGYVKIPIGDDGFHHNCDEDDNG